MTDELDALAARQTMLVEKVARAIASQRNVDADEVIDVFGNKAWSWYAGEARAAIEAVLDAVASELRAVQYDPAPYTAMKVRLAAMRKDALP